jgi:hypothetical protein
MLGGRQHGHRTSVDAAACGCGRCFGGDLPVPTLEPMDPSAARLDRRSRALLDFERDWQVHEGRKEQAVRERFGISAARYYQLLNRVVARPEADAYDPLTVRRLRRRRDERQRRRTAPALREPTGH